MGRGGVRQGSNAQHHTAPRGQGSAMRAVASVVGLCLAIRQCASLLTRLAALRECRVADLPRHVPLHLLVDSPRRVTTAQAATLPCAGLTAWRALVDEGNLQPGQTVSIPPPHTCTQPQPHYTSRLHGPRAQLEGRAPFQIGVCMGGVRSYRFGVAPPVLGHGAPASCCLA